MNISGVFKSFGQNLSSKIFAQSSILSKLMTVIMITVAVTLFLTSAFLAVTEWNAFRSNSDHSITTLSGVIGNNSTAALAFQDTKVGSQILSALRSEPEIFLGCLYTQENKLLAAYVKNELSDHCPLIVPHYGHYFKEGKFAYSSAVLHENESYGSLYLVSNMQNFRERLNLYYALLFAVIIGAGIMAYGIASKLQHLVTAPILRLANTARYISEEGKFSMRAEKSTEIEVNSLVDAFNRMLDTIQERELTITQSEELFRAAFELAAVGNVLLSPDGQFIRVNSELCKMLEYSREELLKFKFSDITHPDDLHDSFKVHEKLMSSKLHSNSFEKRYITKSGAVLWALVTGATIKNSAGDVILIITVIQNITERKRTEEERDKLLVREREARLVAEKSIQMRDEFLLIASHELRTPITPIKIHLTLMKNILESLPPNTIPRQDALMKTSIISERQLYNLEMLTEALLSVSRISTGELVLNRKQIDMSQLVQSVIERCQVESKKSGCQINFAGEPDVIGFWDKMMLEQIVMSIFTNAIKYGAGKPVEVTVSKVGGRARLVVRDYGIGITEENYNKIFEKFGRVASVRHLGGIGLGLYICKEYISVHNGTIHVESKINQGSTFTVELPLENMN